MTLLQSTQRILQPFFRPSTIVGLDIGSRAMKLVVVDLCGSQPRVTTAYRAALAENSIGDERLLQQQLWDGLQDARVHRNSPCVISLPSPLVAYQTQEWHGDTPSDGDASAVALNWMQELLGEDFGRATGDYWWSQSSLSKSEMHLVWTVADVANRVTRAVQASGLRPRSIDAPALALARTTWNRSPQSHVLVIDVGGGEANFVWSNAGVAEYVRSQIRFSPNSAGEQLATARSIDSRSADQILREYGIATNVEHRLANDNLRALEEWLEQFLFEVSRTSQYLIAKYGPNAVGELLLCGGIAEIAGIETLIESRTCIKTRRAELPPDYQWSSAEKYSPAYAQAIALTRQGELL